MTEHTSRRRFLKAAVATGALAGLNAAVLAQEKRDEVILLGGKTAGWQGFRLPGPKTAEGSANPTLTLDAGTTYTLMWKNLDGVPHNFAIQDSQGNNLEVLQPISVEPDVFSKVNASTENQTVDVNFSERNLTNVSIGNETAGNATAGNATGNETLGEGDLGKAIAKTELLGEEGAVQGVRFTATEKMAQYICLVHPNTMVGSIEVSGGGGGGNQTGNNSS